MSLIHKISVGQPIPVEKRDGLLIPRKLIRPECYNVIPTDSVAEWADSLFKPYDDIRFDANDFEMAESDGGAHTHFTVHLNHAKKIEEYIISYGITKEKFHLIPDELFDYASIEDLFEVVETLLYYSAQSEAIFHRHKRGLADDHLVCYESRLVSDTEHGVRHLKNFPYRLDLSVYLSKDPNAYLKYKLSDENLKGDFFVQLLLDSGPGKN